jgi:hypothetical protein
VLHVVVFVGLCSSEPRMSCSIPFSGCHSFFALELNWFW